MEITNDNNPGKEPRKDILSTRNVYLGLVLIVAGLVWLLYNVDVVGSTLFHIIFSWQMLLIVIGGYLVAIRKPTAGAIVAGIGIAFALVDWLDIDIRISRIILPVIVIAGGVALLMRRE